MNDTSHDHPSDERERLEQEANRVRSRLLGDLDELKARGRSVSDRVKSVETTLRAHPGLLVAAGVVTLVAGGIVLFARRAHRRRERRHDAILAFAARLLGPGYVVEPASARPGALRSSLKKAGAALVQEAGREVGRRALLAVRTRATGLEHEGDGAPA